MPIIPSNQPPYYTVSQNAAKSLIYQAILNQTGTDNPTDGNTGNGLINTLGKPTIWTRQDIGLYKGKTNIPQEKINNVYIAGTAFQNSVTTIPITDYETITGYMVLSLTPQTDGIEITLETLDATFAYVDISTLLGTNANLSLPKIEYFT